MLDRTVFYPEAGGQLADRGTATWDSPGGSVSATIVDAQVVGDGDVAHHIELPEGAALPLAGAEVHVTVDAARRRLHMSLHTGQHMLSRALLDLAGAPTISSRLGASTCSIDTPLDALTDEAVADAEALVQSVVQEDRPVRALYPTPEELARLPLRRDPKVQGLIRVIDVDGFDMSPCGGTHVVHTSQVGALHVTGVDRYKGGHRITFHAGHRSLDDYARKDRALQAIIRATSSGVEEAPAAVVRLDAQLRDARREITGLRKRLARSMARDLLAETAGGPVMVLLDGDTVETVRAIASAIADQPAGIAVVAARADDGFQIVAQRGDGADARFEAGAAIRRICQATGGRGGGRPERAEGRAPADARAALRVALAAELARLGDT